MSKKIDLPADVAGWVHDDGTTCPDYLGTFTHGNLFWCTEHQQYLSHPNFEQAPVSKVGR